MPETKTTKQQLLTMLRVVKTDPIIPDNIKNKITEIALEYNNLMNSDKGLSRDAHKGLLLSLVEELTIMSDSGHLNAPEVQARLSLMRPTLEFVKSVLFHKLKNEHEYRDKLALGVEQLELKILEMESRGPEQKK